MKTLNKIICMGDKELGSYLITQLKKYYPKVVTDKENYIYAKGTNAICLVSHIDTVRGKAAEPVHIVVNRNVIKNLKGVLGADDRAGVYGILEVIKTCINYKIALPHVLFTNYEESGGKGVKKFIASGKFQPEGVNLLLELDRKGCNEYVFYSTTLPQPIKDYVQAFGFREERGSYSDIADLTNEYMIPSVNLSVGYYAQHTMMEKLHYDELLMTIERVVDMCTDAPAKLHPVPKPSYLGYRNNVAGSTASEWGDHSNFYSAGNRQQQYKKDRAITSSAINTTAAVAKQTDLDFAKDPDAAVAALIISLKLDIRHDLTTVWSLDAIGQRYFAHRHTVLIIQKLGEIEDAFYSQNMRGITLDKAFSIVWEDMLASEFYKIDPKVATAAVNKPIIHASSIIKSPAAIIVH
jgi:hypothetical protein